MAKYIKLLIVLSTINACGQNTIMMKTPVDIEEQFSKFITKEKFVEESFYPGIEDDKTRAIFSEKINQIANDFKTIAKAKKPTEKKYQEKIGAGLSRFAGMNLDTEDRGRVCMYIEELMDIIELESSNGQLNKFAYGFDPH